MGCAVHSKEDGWKCKAANHTLLMNTARFQLVLESIDRNVKVKIGKLNGFLGHFYKVEGCAEEARRKGFKWFSYSDPNKKYKNSYMDMGWMNMTGLSARYKRNKCWAEKVNK